MSPSNARARSIRKPRSSRTINAAIAGVLPESVESDYIRRLFDDFADHFEATLVDRLSYATPTLLTQFLRQHAADEGASVLDLGCGTGLMAQQLARTGASSTAWICRRACSTTPAPRACIANCTWPS